MSKRKAPARKRGLNTNARSLWEPMAYLSTIGLIIAIGYGSVIAVGWNERTALVAKQLAHAQVEADSNLEAFLISEKNLLEAKRQLHLATIQPPPIKRPVAVAAAPKVDRYDAMRSQTVELIAAGKGHGSGVIISPNFILTVNHVATMADGAPLDVLFSDGTKAHAALVWTDPKRDVSLMALDHATKIKPAKLATALPKVGDETWSAGYPLYLPLAIVNGNVISVEPLNKSFGDQGPSTITIDASIARGDSGGPTFNAAGEVIGLNDIVVADALPGMMPAPFYFGLAGIIGTQFIADDVRNVVGI